MPAWVRGEYGRNSGKQDASDSSAALMRLEVREKQRTVATHSGQLFASTRQPDRFACPCVAGGRPTAGRGSEGASCAEVVHAPVADRKGRKGKGSG